jgi:hypothetical protein
MYNMPNYTYFQTPQSNETSQTYFLERTQSARLTLEKALRILPQNMSSLGGNNNSTTNTENNDVSKIKNTTVFLTHLSYQRDSTIPYRNYCM